MRRLVVLFTLVLVASCGASDTTDADDGASGAATATETDQASSGTDRDAGTAGADVTSAGADEGASAEGDQQDQGDAAAGGDSDATPMAASSPLGAYFADGGGFEAALAEYRMRVEETIVVCMAEQGFEFKASAGGAGTNPVQQLQNEMTEREWTTEYGYGLSTSFDSVLANQTTDPNAEIVFSMSASEREIWIETLFGPGQQGFGIDVGSRPLEEQGCIGQGIIATGGQAAIEGLDDFGSAYEDGHEAILDQDAMIVAVQDWSTCMGEAGYPGHTDPDGPQDEIGSRFREITRPIQAALDDIDPDDARALFTGDVVDADTLPGLDVDALRELQTDERLIAVADLDCYDAHVRAIYEPLRDDFERALMADHADQLDALRNIGG